MISITNCVSWDDESGGGVGGCSEGVVAGVVVVLGCDRRRRVGVMVQVVMVILMIVLSRGSDGGGYGRGRVWLEEKEWWGGEWSC